jgi:hypothetical protein
MYGRCDTRLFLSTEFHSITHTIAIYIDIYYTEREREISIGDSNPNDLRKQGVNKKVSILRCQFRPDGTNKLLSLFITRVLVCTSSSLPHSQPGAGFDFMCICMCVFVKSLFCLYTATAWQAGVEKF